ncbi:MAG: sugar phosphate isomerase/epimerase [Pirellulales bacterium]|nr:sugar phosphate isomerase/epimerase [Pirellulales bacterium]
MVQASRRQFLQVGAAAGFAVAGVKSFSAAAVASPGPTARRIYTSVKWGMIAGDAPALDKFRLCREIGLDGMELVSPVDGFTVEEAVAASRATGMPVHGVVDMKHWEVRLSDPAAEVRDQGAAILDQAVRDARALGGDSVLLVPGKIGDTAETHDDVWSRSIAGIRRVLPTASKLGVRILIEPVWNGFCETPELLRDYLDEINHPWVGCYFDLGNMIKFSSAETWIKRLGSRIVKLDVKDWSPARGFCKIGDGAVDWPAVREALEAIDFTGWCTAEVEGGGRAELADVTARMHRVLGLPAPG